MKYCTKCGAQLADDDDYCYFCGAKFEEIKQEEPKEQPTFQDQSYYEDRYYGQRPNTVALLGFVFAFLSPIVGLILSIIGLKKAKEFNGLGKGYAIAGIIISVVSMILSVLLYSYLVSVYGTEGIVS